MTHHSTRPPLLLHQAKRSQRNPAWQIRKCKSARDEMISPNWNIQLIWTTQYGKLLVYYYNCNSINNVLGTNSLALQFTKSPLHILIYNASSYTIGAKRVDMIMDQSLRIRSISNLLILRSDSTGTRFTFIVGEMRIIVDNIARINLARIILT